MLNSRNSVEKLIITAMDRFVWFVLLVVMTHLVTEITRVTGYARGTRNDVVVVNDSLIQPLKVQNMVLYPGQEYGLYERQQPYYYNTNNNGNNNYNNINNNNNNYGNYNNNNNDKKNVQTNAALLLPGNNNYGAATNGQIQGFPFSFQPIIDSIFQIPISTLRAVNNLVARLTGGYQQAPTNSMTEFKSAPLSILPSSSSSSLSPPVVTSGFNAQSSIRSNIAIIGTAKATASKATGKELKRILLTELNA